MVGRHPFYLRVRAIHGAIIAGCGLDSEPGRLTKRSWILEMAGTSLEQSGRRQARIAFLLLTMVPLLPELVIWVTAMIAQSKGCQLDQEPTCLIGTLPASDIISFALRAGGVSFVAGMRASAPLVWVVVLGLAMIVWLVACYAALTRGWIHIGTRLLLGFAVVLLFAVLRFFGPLVAVANLENKNCRPTLDVVSCRIFGGVIGGTDPNLAYDTINLGWLSVVGGSLLALGIFAIYAVVVVVISAKRPST